MNKNLEELERDWATRIKQKHKTHDLRSLMALRELKQFKLGNIQEQICNNCGKSTDALYQTQKEMCVWCATRVKEIVGKAKVNNKKIPTLPISRKLNRDNMPCQTCGREDQLHLWKSPLFICKECEEKIKRYV